MIRKLFSVVLVVCLLVAVSAPQANASASNHNYYQVNFSPNRGRYIATSGNVVSDIASVGSWSGWDTSVSSGYIGQMWYSDSSGNVVASWGGASFSSPTIYSTFSYWPTKSGSDYPAIIPEGSSVHFDASGARYAFLNNDSLQTQYSSTSFSFWLRLWRFDSASNNFYAVYTSPAITFSDSSSVSIDTPELSADIARIDLILGKKFSISSSVMDGTPRPCIPSTYSLSYTFEGISNQIGDIQQTNHGILSTLGNLFDFVLSIPQLLIDGIKGLFVPSSDDLNTAFSSFNDFLEQKLGFVWQISEVLGKFVIGVHTATSVTSVSFPGISLPLAGSVFTLAPHSVDLSPPEFVSIITPIKLITTTVFIGAWLSGVQRVLDWIIKKEGYYG